MKNLNQTNKLLLTVIFFLFALLSCDNNSVSLDTKCKVESEEFRRSSSSDFQYYATYTYDGSKLIKMVVREVSPTNTFERVTSLSYDSKGNLTETNRGIYRTVYTISNGLVNKIEYFDGPTLANWRELEYDNINKIVKAQIYYGNGIKYGYTNYSYSSNDQVNKIEEYLKNGTLLNTTEYEYDDKKYPYENMPLYFEKSDILLGFPVSQKNNVTKETYKSGDPINTFITTYSYEYNSDGYPIKQVATLDNNSITTIYLLTCN